MDLFLQQVLNGLTLGGIYSLVALGLTLVYGILHVPNFAHGAFYMAGAFASFHLMKVWGFNYWIAMVGSALCVAAIATLAEYGGLVFGISDSSVQHGKVSVKKRQLQAMASGRVGTNAARWATSAHPTKPDRLGLVFGRVGNLAHRAASEHPGGQQVPTLRIR
jgi:hypothetical protein